MPRPDPTTPELWARLVEAYKSGMSTHLCSSTFGINRRTVSRYLQRDGIRVRGLKEACPGLPLHHDAFASPETNDEAAYWTGFLMADGCISVNGHHGSPHVILVLSVVDIDHIRSFQNFVGATNSIQKVMPTTNRQLFRSGECARLDLVSRQMVDDLSRYGVTPKKTHTAKVSDQLAFNRHFWRGVIDGDGSLSSRVDAPVLQLTGSIHLTTQFSRFSSSVSQSTSRPCKSRGSFNVCVSSSPAVRLIRHLYSDCSVALPRKLAKAREVMGRFPV